MRKAAADHGYEPQEHADEAIRRCAVTRARRPKDDLIRFVLDPGGTVVPDIRERLPGRGVWLTAAQDTVADAAKRKVFAGALKAAAKVPEGLAETVDRLLAEAASSALALANKAGEASFGHAKVKETIAGGRLLALIHAREAAEDGCRKLDGKALSASGGRAIPALRALSTAELSLATGRANVIHAALIQGGAAQKVLSAVRRLERYRRGQTAYLAQNGTDTDEEKE